MSAYDLSRRTGCLIRLSLGVLLGCLLYGISVDELVGLKDTAAKRGPMPKLQRQIEQVALLPKAKQKFVSDMLETVIQQTAH